MGYTLHVYTAGGEKDTLWKLLAVYMDTPLQARTAGVVDGYTMHVCTAGGEEGYTCGGAPSVPTVLSRLDRHVTYYPHICCSYVDTHPSLPSLKYTVVTRLLTCLHLSTSGDPAFDFTRGHTLTTTRY